MDSSKCEEHPLPKMNDEKTYLLNVSVSGEDSCHHEIQLRKRLKFFFMTPCQKVRVRRHLPVKLSIQILKVLVITLQVLLFGIDRSSHIEFIHDHQTMFERLFLKNWDPAYETLPYPPSMGAYSVLTKNDFYEHVDHAVAEFNESLQWGISHFAFVPINESNLNPLIELHNNAGDLQGKDNELNNSHSQNNSTDDPFLAFCIWKYRNGTFAPGKRYYSIDSRIEKKCLKFNSYLFNKSSEEYENFSLRKLIEKEWHNELDFDLIVQSRLIFELRTIQLSRPLIYHEPICYQIHTEIVYENRVHSGRMDVSLNLLPFMLQCHGNIYGENTRTYNSSKEYYVCLDVIVILLSVLSFILCIRSIYRAQNLKRDVQELFGKYEIKLTKREKDEFLKLWYILIIINDILACFASIFKLLCENGKMTNSLDLPAIFLGGSAMLAWFGMLRYLSFFPRYNIVILILRASIPNVMRYMICAISLYFGFTLFAWVVFGPYHIKFRSLSVTSDNLFALLNGDEIFVTYTALKSNNQFIQILLQIYLYVFIFLFIYVVLSLFLAVILDSYDTKKIWFDKGFPKTNLQLFIANKLNKDHLPVQCCPKIRYDDSSDSSDELSENSLQEIKTKRRKLYQKHKRFNEFDSDGRSMRRSRRLQRGALSTMSLKDDYCRKVDDVTFSYDASNMATVKNFIKKKFTQRHSTTYQSIQ
ncbi:hypothetical protein SNEBB_005855 [Seison nebaliae]|nr:hypothetical protein SNEBB_005855 [Seison nebaliae]